MAENIIAITGLTASGKSTIADIIHRERGIEVFRTFETLYPIAKERGFNHYYNFVKKLEREGENKFYSLFIDKIENKTPKNFIIESFAKKSNLKLIEERFSCSPKIMAVSADFPIRLRRKIKRENISRKRALNEMSTFDKERIEWGFYSFYDSADYKINNNNEIENTKEQVIKAIENWP